LKEESMRAVRNVGVAIALCLTAQPALAQTCMPQQVGADVFITLIPTILDEAAERCVAVGAPSPLAEPGARLLRDRLTAESAKRTASAAIGFRAISGEKLPGVTDNTIVALMRESLPKKLLGKQKFDRLFCSHLGQMFTSMAPMSADQVGTMLVSLMGLVNTREFNICP
jgi:hypothetical protein